MSSITIFSRSMPVEEAQLSWHKKGFGRGSAEETALPVSGTEGSSASGGVSFSSVTLFRHWRGLPVGTREGERGGGGWILQRTECQMATFSQLEVGTWFFSRSHRKCHSSAQFAGKYSAKSNGTFLVMQDYCVKGYLCNINWISFTYSQRSYFFLFYFA